MMRTPSRLRLPSIMHPPPALPDALIVLCGRCMACSEGLPFILLPRWSLPMQYVVLCISKYRYSAARRDTPIIVLYGSRNSGRAGMFPEQGSPFPGASPPHPAVCRGSAARCQRHVPREPPPLHGHVLGRGVLAGGGRGGGERRPGAHSGLCGRTTPRSATHCCSSLRRYGRCGRCGRCGSEVWTWCSRWAACGPTTPRVGYLLLKPEKAWKVWYCERTLLLLCEGEI